MNTGYYSSHLVMFVNLGGLDVSVIVLDFVTNISFVLCFRNRTVVFPALNPPALGSSPTLILSFPYWIYALMLRVIPDMRICPFAIVSCEYDFRSSDNSEYILSITDV